jgi:hypothetical protein
VILRCSPCQNLFESHWNGDELAVQCTRCLTDPGWHERERQARLFLIKNPDTPGHRAWATRLRLYGPNGVLRG